MPLDNNVEVAKTQGQATPDSSLYDSIMQGPPVIKTEQPVVSTDVPPPGAVAVTPDTAKTQTPAEVPPPAQTTERQAAPQGTDVVPAPSAVEVGENTTGKVDERTTAPAVAPPEGTVPVAPGAPTQPDTSGRPQEIVPPGVPAPAEGVEDKGNCDFKPDFKYETEHGRQWKAVSDQRRGLGVEVNENGRYKVEYGDSLSAIAERNLKGSGLAHDRKAVEAEVAQIVTLNSNRYPSLSCNNHYIKTGWTLTIPRHQPGEAPPAPAQPAPPRMEAPVPAEPPRQAPPRVEVLPPEQRRPAHTHGRDSGVYINQADNVNIYQGGQDAPPPVVRRPQPAPSYYEGPPEYIPQRRESVVMIDPRDDYRYSRGDDYRYSRGDDYRYQQRPPYRPQYRPDYGYDQQWRTPPFVNDGCFGDNNRYGRYDRYDRYDSYDRNCRTNGMNPGRLAIDLLLGGNRGGRYMGGRMPYMNDYGYGQFNNYGGHRRGSSVGISLRF